MIAPVLKLVGAYRSCVLIRSRVRLEVTTVISVLVVDDHSFVRAQVTGVLHGADGIEVVGECADGAEVVSMAALVRPDVVLMDVRMPVVSGPDGHP